MAITDTSIFLCIYGLILAVPLGLYIRWQAKKEKIIHATIAAGQVYSEGPRGQHPQVDLTNCIGCQLCTRVCPEGDVLSMIGGKAAFVKPHKCIGHSLCAEACPVGAITMVRAIPGLSADMPYLSEELETSVPNMYIIGELGGLALIKNAAIQGKQCIETVARRLETLARPGVEDVVIVGAGPAGISATLGAIERKLKYITLERETLGGTVSKYPRQKVVMTSPIQFPLGITLKKMQLSKENLLAFWQTVCNREDFKVNENEPVQSIKKQPDGTFTIVTPKAEYRSRAVVLALGRAGTPRKLGVKGEDLPKVMYRLIEADHYINNHILVVGGGDSAVEAAMGLAMQPGNTVTLSYRKESFSRIKERNTERMKTVLRDGKLKVVMNSIPVEILEDKVLLEVAGEVRELPNDYVWVFAGGIAPNDFLKSMGIGFGPKDMTREVVLESASVAAAAAVRV